VIRHNLPQKKLEKSTKLQNEKLRLAARVRAFLTTITSAMSEVLTTKVEDMQDWIAMLSSRHSTRL
jgi:hypothetical protein